MCHSQAYRRLGKLKKALACFANSQVRISCQVFRVNANTYPACLCCLSVFARTLLFVGVKEHYEPYLLSIIVVESEEYQGLES